MIVNLIVIFISIILGITFLDKKAIDVNSSINRKRYIGIVCFVLILQSGLRNLAVGDDTYQYYRIYEYVKQLSWQEIYDQVLIYYGTGIGKDPGYFVFLKIVQYVISNYQIFLFFIAIIFFTALGNFIYKNTAKLEDAIFAFVLYSALFYSFFSITGLRQTIATAATLYSFEFIKKHKLIPFLMLILLASTLHKSCFVFVPLYFLTYIKNVRILYVTILLLLPVMFLYRDGTNEFLRILANYDEQFQMTKGAGTYTFTLLMLTIAFICLWRIKYILQVYSGARSIVYAFSLALFFTPLTWVNPAAMRIVQYFSIFLLLLIPLIIKSFKYDSKKTEYLALGLVISLLVVLYIKNGWQQGHEYKFFWQNMKLNEFYDVVS